MMHLIPYISFSNICIKKVWVGGEVIMEASMIYKYMYCFYGCRKGPESTGKFQLGIQISAEFMSVISPQPPVLF